MKLVGAGATEQEEAMAREAQGPKSAAVLSSLKLNIKG